jgi:hypothetical protein
MSRTAGTFLIWVRERDHSRSLLPRGCLIATSSGSNLPGSMLPMLKLASAIETCSSRSVPQKSSLSAMHNLMPAYRYWCLTFFPIL